VNIFSLELTESFFILK